MRRLVPQQERARLVVSAILLLPEQVPLLEQARRPAQAT
jgi:hypothetical protein